MLIPGAFRLVDARDIGPGLLGMAECAENLAVGEDWRAAERVGDDMIVGELGWGQSAGAAGAVGQLALTPTFGADEGRTLYGLGEFAAGHQRATHR